MKKILTSLTVALTLSWVSAQISFTDNTSALGLSGNYSGVAIAVLDINGDGYDDIARLQDGQMLSIEYQQPDGSFNTVSGGINANDSEWTMCAGDVDNNGIIDIFTAGAYNGVKLAKGNADGSSFTVNNLPGPGLFAQGSNYADINNDGWLDVFICHDDAESRIWGNDGSGNLIQADAWINMDKPNSDDSGNYGSVWTDFDNDGDIDLYIAKCRQGVNDPTDARRVNTLYVNDGNGNYIDRAEEYGLAIGAQSWTADFADYDNDGDFDCFITNHDAPSQLLRNDSDYFTDVTTEAGIDVSVTAIQAIMEDFDNDGFVDLLVSGSDEEIYHNNGDGTFTKLAGVFNNEDMESFAIGDLDHDGFLDVYGGYAEIYTTPSDVADIVWLNEGNSNNFIAINLEGVESNRSAVGAKVQIFGDWGVQTREVRAGESYGIVNSFSQHFGIGQSTSIDQIVVWWPSGNINIVENPSPNQYINIVENTCSGPPSDITLSAVPIICSGESLTLTAPSGYTYLWSTGETSSSVTINEPGSYALIVMDATDCASGSMVNIGTPQPLDPSISLDGSLKFCEGGSVSLTAETSTTPNSYSWSSGQAGAEITVSETGTFQVTVSNDCEDFVSEIVTTEVLATPPTPTSDDVTINSSQSATLTAQGNNIVWYEDAAGTIELGTGTNFETPVLTETTTYYVGDELSYDASVESTGMPDHFGNNYSSAEFNGEIIFDVLQEINLKSVKVYTDFPGDRVIELKDNSGAVIESTTVNITGEQIITLDYVIPPGNDYVLTTNAGQNNSVFGNISPELKRNREGVNYPYVVQGAVSINDSNYGGDYYYYFYDWVVEIGTVCRSGLSPVTVTVEQASSILQLGENGSVKAYPNPVNDGFLNLDMKWTSSEDVQVHLYDAIGRKVKSFSWISTSGEQSKEVDMSGFASGIYSLRFAIGETSYTTKIVIQKR